MPFTHSNQELHYDIVCFLIDAGANVNDYTPKDDMYISHQAVYTAVTHCIPKYGLQCGTYEDSLKILKYLIEHRMDINLTDNKGVNSFFHGVNLSHSMIHSTSECLNPICLIL